MKGTGKNNEEIITKLEILKNEESWEFQDFSMKLQNGI